MPVLIHDNHNTDRVLHDNITASASSDVFPEYPYVFEGIGCLKGKYHIKKYLTIKTVIYRSRRVTATLKDSRKKELERMVREGNVTPISDLTDLVSSMLTVVKPNKLNICIDPKDLNRAIKRSHYSIPTIEVVATTSKNFLSS